MRCRLLILPTLSVNYYCNNLSVSCFQARGISQQSVSKNGFTPLYYEIYLQQKNTSQQRLPVHYSQANGEIEYCNGALKPLLSYHGRKRLENLHHKLPADFQTCIACRNACAITMQDTCKASCYQIMDTHIREKWNRR